METLKSQLPKQCVLDGEMVIAQDGALAFEALQMRLHPAESRVKKLAAEIPASVVFFDLLCEGKKNLMGKPFAERRDRLAALGNALTDPLHITPATRDRWQAEDWFRRFEGAGLDGVIAKHQAEVYQPNKRVMFKVKHEREADCVVPRARSLRSQTVTPNLLYQSVSSESRRPVETGRHSAGLPDLASWS